MALTEWIAFFCARFSRTFELTFEFCVRRMLTSPPRDLWGGWNLSHWPAEVRWPSSWWCQSQAAVEFVCGTAGEAIWPPRARRRRPRARWCRRRLHTTRVGRPRPAGTARRPTARSRHGQTASECRRDRARRQRGLEAFLLSRRSRVYMACRGRSCGAGTASPSRASD